MIRLLLALVVLALAACRSAPGGPPPDEFRRSVAGGDWELVTLRDQPAAVGGGGRRATLRFADDSARVSGFAGCNRYFGSYTMSDGSTLTFGTIAMTRMACAEGMELERELAEAFRRTSRYTLADGRLTLLDATGPVAGFVRADR